MQSRQALGKEKRFRSEGDHRKHTATSSHFHSRPKQYTCTILSQNSALSTEPQYKPFHGVNEEINQITSRSLLEANIKNHFQRHPENICSLAKVMSMQLLPPIMTTDIFKQQEKPQLDRFYSASVNRKSLTSIYSVRVS